MWHGSQRSTPPALGKLVRQSHREEMSTMVPLRDLFLHKPISRDSYLFSITSKLASTSICDRHALLFGSANLTSYGLGSNFGAGALLAEEAGRGAASMIDGILHSRSAYLQQNMKIANRRRYVVSTTCSYFRRRRISRLAGKRRIM